MAGLSVGLPSLVELQYHFIGIQIWQWNCKAKHLCLTYCLWSVCGVLTSVNELIVVKVIVQYRCFYSEGIFIHHKPKLPSPRGVLLFESDVHVHPASTKYSRCLSVTLHTEKKNGGFRWQQNWQSPKIKVFLFLIKKKSWKIRDQLGQNYVFHPKLIMDTFL